MSDEKSKTTEFLLETVQKLESTLEETANRKEQLENRVEQLEDKASNLKRELEQERADSLKYGCLGLVLLVIVGALIFLIYTALTKSSGVPEFCYVEAEELLVKRNTEVVGTSKEYSLMASLPWESDRSLGSFKTVEEALTTAKQLNCAVK